MENPFSWDYLTTAPGPDDVFGPFATLFLIICAVGLIVGGLFYLRPEVMWSRRLLRLGSTKRWGAIFLWIFSLGIFFFIIRWLQINPFSFGERIWLYLILLVAVFALALMVMQIRFESNILSHEQSAKQAAIAKGIHGRRPPRRSRNKKR